MSKLVDFHWTTAVVDKGYPFHWWTNYARVQLILQVYTYTRERSWCTAGTQYTYTINQYNYIIYWSKCLTDLSVPNPETIKPSSMPRTDRHLKAMAKSVGSLSLKAPTVRSHAINGEMGNVFSGGSTFVQNQSSTGRCYENKVCVFSKKNIKMEGRSHLARILWFLSQGMVN